MTGGADDPEIDVRAATPDDHVPVVRVLEGALLDVDPAAVEGCIDRGTALVAVPADSERTSVVGALVRDGNHVEAVAVTAAWRRRGVGRALVERAHADAGRLTADFDPDVREFYAALGFEVKERDGRPWGTLE